MSEPSENELAAADAYLRTHAPTDNVSVQIHAAFLAGIDWNQTRCRVCDTVECGTWYCYECHKLVEHGTPVEQALPELLAACVGVLRDFRSAHHRDGSLDQNNVTVSRSVITAIEDVIERAEPPTETKGGDCRP